MNTIKAYVYNSISYEYTTKRSVKYNVDDIYYIDIDKYNETHSISTSRGCLRLYNFISSFYLCKLPGMTEDEFKKFVKDTIGHMSNIKINFTYEYNNKTLRDSMFYDFGNRLLYAEIKAKASSYLNKANTLLRKECLKYYEELDYDDLNKFDKLFYDNTETPFRFDMTVLSGNNISYHLATKYNIPHVGGLLFNYYDKQVQAYPTKEEDLKDIPGLRINDKNISQNTLFIDMSESKEEAITFDNFKHDETINGLNTLILLSYDIETYESSTRILTEEEKIIMCIGVGIFDITDDKPKRRYCISLKDFDNKDVPKDRKLEIENKEKSIYKTVSFEYSTNNEDKTKYIIVDNEKELLMTFIRLIKQFQPNFITGFNNYGFDDRRIWERMKYYNISDVMLSVLSYYDLNNSGVDITKYKAQVPIMETFSIKIDSEMYSDNKTWTGLTTAIMTDVYKIMLASNAKLYTQQGRGNLDTMLEVNNIHNPYNSSPLSKSGLTYSQMWYNWDNNVNIYDILLYCCQDAWITGTLLIKSCQLIDKIEMSTLSCTTISDSVYKAVTWRVKHLVENYAWRYNFAVADLIKSKNVMNKETKKSEHISRADNHDLGNKSFDVRQIVGGEVKSISPGKNKYIVALDFSAMYPSQKEGSNIDTSTMVPYDVIANPEDYGLKVDHEPIKINDMYKERNIYYLSDEKDNKYIIEQFTSEFKNNKDEIKKCLNNMLNDYVDSKTSPDYVSKRSKLMDDLRKLQPNTYLQITQQIYNENININDIIENIPDTEKVKLYTVQSPRDKITNLVSEHYSLKEIMLSDLRSLRSKVKKLMSAASDALEKNRQNSKQLAIKVMMNSEYGASNSSYFPYYDPLIGGATTAASRCLINFLSITLAARKLYVNEEFIKKNLEYLDILRKYNVLKYYEEKIYDKKEFVKNNRKYSLRILFDEYYELIYDKLWVIEIEPSRVVYQDTDSNYYTNDYIKGLLIDNETPEIISLKMNLLMTHNKLIGNFLENAIYRKPISVGFEGAFIVARYFNVKKKYYGIVWGEHMKGELPKECYKNGILINDYSKFWAPGKTTFPLPNGDYIKVDRDDIIRSNKDKLKLIKSQNVKCTGVDLARRDQYKFINANHIRIIQNDLHFLKYEGHNKWVDISNVDMINVILNLVKEFKEQYDGVCSVVEDMMNNKKPSFDYKLFYDIGDFAKDVSFKYHKCDFIQLEGTDSKFIIDEEKRDDKIIYSVQLENFGETLYLTKNEEGYYINIRSAEFESRKSDIEPVINSIFELNRIGNKNDVMSEVNKYVIKYDGVQYDKFSKIMMTIGDRIHKTIEDKQIMLNRKLTDSEFEDLFPSAFSRKQYVIMMTEAVKLEREKRLKTDSINSADKAFLIEELQNNYKKSLSEEDYNKLKYHDLIKYDDFINLQIISNLDIVHYVDAFCNSIALYLMDDIENIVPPELYKASASVDDKKKAISYELVIKIFPDRKNRNKCKKPKEATKIRTKGINQILITKLKENNILLTNEEITEINEHLKNNIKLIYIDDDLIKFLSNYEKKFNKMVKENEIDKVIKTKDFKPFIQRIKYLKELYNIEKTKYEHKLYYMEYFNYYIENNKSLTYYDYKAVSDEGIIYFKKYFEIGGFGNKEKFINDYDRYKNKVKDIMIVMKLIDTIIKKLETYKPNKETKKETKRRSKKETK